MDSKRALTLEPLGQGWFAVRDGDRTWRVAIATSGDTRWVFVDGQVAEIDMASAGPRGADRATRLKRRRDTGVMAPMPATVVALNVGPGQSVTHGDTIVVLEAMKMELPLRAPKDGVVKAVHCAVGELVQPGIALVEFE